MMDIINGFDNATAIMGGGSQQLPAGVYVGKVVNVKLKKKGMLINFSITVWKYRFSVTVSLGS